MKLRTRVSFLICGCVIAGFAYLAKTKGWDLRYVRLSPTVETSPVQTSRTPNPVISSVPTTQMQVEPLFSLHIGDEYSKAVVMYGETKHEGNGYRSWNRDAFSLTVVVDQGSIIRHLWVRAKPGAVLCTPDGFCLGRDTAEIFAQKARQASLSFHEEMLTGEGHTALVEERVFLNHEGVEEKQDYTWSIDEGDKIDGKPFQGVSESQLSKKIFANVVVASYSLDSTDPKYRDRPDIPGTENLDGGE
jgi:hypothetical protein